MTLISLLCPRCLGDQHERDHAYKCRPIEDPPMTANPTQTETWVRYERTGVIEARPWTEDDVAIMRLSGRHLAVAVHNENREAAMTLPPVGFVGRNPDNDADLYYIQADYFAKHYRPADRRANVAECVGICGAPQPRIFDHINGANCSLPHGHSGWHSDGAAHWSQAPDAAQAAPPTAPTVAMTAQLREAMEAGAICLEAAAIEHRHAHEHMSKGATKGDTNDARRAGELASADKVRHAALLRAAAGEAK